MPSVGLSVWNLHINSWLEGGSSVPGRLEAWSRANGGRGDSAPVLEALPEPWFGDSRRPAVVFLALNPGQAFLGRELWRQRQLLPDLQSRNGAFAQEIRLEGAYSRWARHFPDWTRWVRPGNAFYLSRFRFARDWVGDTHLDGDSCLLVELYPWHSRRFNAGAFKPGQEALQQIYTHVLRPLERMPAAPVFAFGSAWSSVLPRLDFIEQQRWSVRNGDALGQVLDRTVSVFQRESLRIVAEKHAGGATPPKSIDVAVLKDVVGPCLT